MYGDLVVYSISKAVFRINMNVFLVGFSLFLLWEGFINLSLIMNRKYRPWNSVSIDDDKREKYHPFLSCRTDLLSTPVRNSRKIFSWGNCLCCFSHRTQNKDGVGAQIDRAKDGKRQIDDANSLKNEVIDNSNAENISSKFSSESKDSDYSMSVSDSDSSFMLENLSWLDLSVVPTRTRSLMNVNYFNANEPVGMKRNVKSEDLNRIPSNMSVCVHPMWDEPSISSLSEAAHQDLDRMVFKSLQKERSKLKCNQGTSYVNQWTKQNGDLFSEYCSNSSSSNADEGDGLREIQGINTRDFRSKILLEYGARLIKRESKNRVINDDFEDSSSSTTSQSSSSDGGEVKMNLPSHFFCNPSSIAGVNNQYLQRRILLKPLAEQFDENFNPVFKDRTPVLYKLKRKFNTWKYSQWPYYY